MDEGRFTTRAGNFGGLHSAMEACHASARLARCFVRSFTGNFCMILFNDFVVRLRVTFLRRIVRGNGCRVQVSNTHSVSRRRNDIRRFPGFSAFCRRYNLCSLLCEGRIVVCDACDRREEGNYVYYVGLAVKGGSMICPFVRYHLNFLTRLVRYLARAFHSSYYIRRRQ